MEMVKQPTEMDGNGDFQLKWMEMVISNQLKWMELVISNQFGPPLKFNSEFSLKSYRDPIGKDRLPSTIFSGANCLTSWG